MITPPMALDQREEWFELAHAALDAVLAEGRQFTTDDLRDKVPAPGHPNWWGTFFAAARESERIKSIGFQLSKSRSRKGGILRIWTAA